MGTDESSLGGADAPPFTAPAAPELLAPPAAPAPAPERRSRVRQWVGALVCVAAVAVAAAAVVAYGRATDDRRAAERDLVRSQRDLSDATVRADAAEADAESQRTRADDAEASADQLGTDLAGRDTELERYRTRLSEFVAASFEFGVGLTSSDAACIGDAFVADQGPDAFDFLSSGFSAGPGPDEFVVDLLNYADGCGIDPSNFDPGTPLEPGFAYGDNATLDALWDACASGDGQACDDLFLTSEADSEYEQFGLTCGDRFEPVEAPESCVGSI